MDKIVQIADYRKPKSEDGCPYGDKCDQPLGEPIVRDLWNKIRRDMCMGVTFWDYETKQQLVSPKDILEHFIFHIALQIRSPLDKNGEPVVLCDARKKGEECPSCQEVEGKIGV